MAEYESFNDFLVRQGFPSRRELYLQYLYGTWEPSADDLDTFECRYLSPELASAFATVERIKWEEAKNGQKA